MKIHFPATLYGSFVFILQKKLLEFNFRNLVVCRPQFSAFYSGRWNRNLKKWSHRIVNIDMADILEKKAKGLLLNWSPHFASSGKKCSKNFQRMYLSQIIILFSNFFFNQCMYLLCTNSRKSMNFCLSSVQIYWKPVFFLKSLYLANENFSNGNISASVCLWCM